MGNDLDTSDVRDLYMYCRDTEMMLFRQLKTDAKLSLSFVLIFVGYTILGFALRSELRRNVDNVKDVVREGLSKSETG